MPDSPSTIHNKKLTAEYIARSKVHSRYPKVSDQVETLALETPRLPAYAYNPSLYRANGKTLLSFRHHPKPGEFQTVLGLAELGANGTVSSHWPLDTGHAFSAEDARLFSLHGEPWMSWVEAKWEGRFENPKAVVKYSRLDQAVNPATGAPKWTLARIYQPKAGGNDWSSMQKNWAFFESDENLFCLFETVPEQIVFQIQGDQIVNEYRSAATRWPYGAIRGGSIIPWNGKLLRIFHSSLDHTWQDGKVEKRYFIGAALMHTKPPFNVLSVSKYPIIYGSESDFYNTVRRLACHHWKANVAFPCGAIPDGDNILVALGVNDAACSVARIKPSQFNL